jgi:hypothetical protein
MESVENECGKQELIIFTNLIQILVNFTFVAQLCNVVHFLQERLDHLHSNNQFTAFALCIKSSAEFLNQGKEVISIDCFRE